MTNAGESFHTGVYATITDAAGLHILLIRKARGAYTGLYDLPGGTPESGETPYDTLVREIREETGCTVLHARPLPDAHTRYAHMRHGKAHVLNHRGILYAASISGTPKDDGDGEDSNGCVWVPIDTLDTKTASPMVLAAIKLCGAA